MLCYSVVYYIILYDLVYFRFMILVDITLCVLCMLYDIVFMLYYIVCMLYNILYDIAHTRLYALLYNI